MRRPPFAVVWVLLVLFCVGLSPGCMCEGAAPAAPRAVLPCIPQHSLLSSARSAGSAEVTAEVGALSAHFSVSSTGEGTLLLPLVSVPGRAGIEPDLALVYESSGGDGPLGMGFSLSGASAITRCPKNVALDGEIRAVRFDAYDDFCLDGKRLVRVGEEDGVVEYRTFPDTQVKVLGSFPGGDTSANPEFFEVFLPSGIVMEYGTTAVTRPLALDGVPRAWLAAKMRDGRGNAMTYGYCFAQADGFTAEYALDEIRYTSFEGSPSVEGKRTVRLVYGVKDAADIRRSYAGGMALQESLRLDEIQMLGPDSELVRSYDLLYALGPTTGRTLLTEVKECGGDGACKRPTRFLYQSGELGFERIKTDIPAPVSKLASPLLADVNTDGRDDLVIPDINAALSTPENPRTDWLVARSTGSKFAPPTLSFVQVDPPIFDPSGPADPALLQPELGTVLDYDQDGRADFFLHDVRGANQNETVLLSQAAGTLAAVGTGISRPFPVGALPVPPGLKNPRGSTHLADLSGDGVADLIQCDDHGGVPGQAQWRMFLFGAEGFAEEGEKIALLDGFACNVEIYTTDIDADGKIDLVVPRLLTAGDTEQVPASTYAALSRRENGSYEVFDIKLPLVAAPGRLLFADVNGDALPDAIASGFSDGRLYIYMNTGRAFAPPIPALEWDGLFPQDSFFPFAAPLDFDGDGRTDLLMPLSAGKNAIPRWVVLRAMGAPDGFSFSVVETEIPFDAEIDDAISLADPRLPRIGDVNGDGAADIVMLVGGFFEIFRNKSVDPDVLVSFSDGMAEDVPNVEISYGHLVDIGDDLYDPQFDPTNECKYPRRCVVGPKRVVRGYLLSDGMGGQRNFEMRYRDGRFHRLGHGFLGFGARELLDLDTGTRTVDLYDNSSAVDIGGKIVFPFAGQIKRHEQIFTTGDKSIVELGYSVVPTNDGKTFFTLPTERRAKRLQGTTVLRDTTTEVTDVDDYGNVLAVDVFTMGADVSLHLERTVENDTDRWILGQPRTQKECSTAAGAKQCRLLTTTTTTWGEIATEKAESDDQSKETRLAVAYDRDVFGNITTVTADDAYGHHRVATTFYDDDGVFPVRHVNAAGHETGQHYDARFGQLDEQRDANGLVTRWFFDGLGRLIKEERPDGSSTIFSLSLSNGGKLARRSTTTGGEDEETIFDGLGRPIRMFWHGPSPKGTEPRRMQVLGYDRLTGKLAKKSVPAAEGTPTEELVFDEFEYDALGREIRHVSPWGAVTKTIYDSLKVDVEDPFHFHTVFHLDALGRTEKIVDAKKGEATYGYGPFGLPFTVKDPGGALFRTTRDAFGRPSKIEDPDRGTTILEHDGFGDLVSSIDALGRVTSFEFDPLGRVISRIDKQGATSETTTWQWDTAAKGIGRLHKVKSPEGEKAFSYNGRSLIATISLAVTGAEDVLEASFSFDAFGRAVTTRYPSPFLLQPFVVRYEYDKFGHRIAVKDDATGVDYWRLDDVDEAGRYRREIFGNDVVTERAYDATKQTLKSIESFRGAATIQDLGYEFDARLDLKSRTDALQAQNKTERFRYDELERLTCAYFGAAEDPLAPCASSYGYAPNGNLTFKSDIGTLFYGDPAHPHAVTSAGGAIVQHDTVGNQVKRPSGATVKYTAFDLPRTVTEGPSVTSFGYDGDQQRIRKTSPTRETLYLEELYERVEEGGVVANRYFVHSPERVIAVVTRGGPEAGTRYLHADHLGSVDVVTDEKGAVVEKRSYDAFGQRRNPVWGQPNPPAFGAKTTKGFTGHESDDELGLINMRGRVYDPKLGRFLTVDPMISAPYFGQSYNGYSYVVNNPLTFVDPFGLEPEREPIYPISSRQWTNADGTIEIDLRYPPRGVKPLVATNEDAAGAGATAPPVDVSVTGNGAPAAEPSGAASEAPGYFEHPRVQYEGAFLGGLCLGIVPFAGLGEQVLEGAGVLDQGTPEAEFGLAMGQIVGGLLALSGGVTGEILGGIASVTGIGAVLGVPVAVVSTGLVIGGLANIGAGVRGLTQAWMSGGGGGKKEPPEHHVMTNKNGTSTDRGGPWTPEFEKMAKKAGMTLDDAANKVRVPGHKGPHPEAYHREVYKRLEKATRGLSGDAYTRAFLGELAKLRTEAATPGTRLNQLLVR